MNWIEKIRLDIINPRLLAIIEHPFMKSMQDGTAKPEDARNYFSGLMWHLLDFGSHVDFLMNKRPPEVMDFLNGNSEDEDGDTDILGKIVAAFGDNPDRIAIDPWTYRPDPIWIQHDALLRSAIYSQDLPWQVGAAALNVGIESLVPTMIEGLFKASVENYGITTDQAQWLQSRSGEEEKQHGENGFLLLKEFVSEDDELLIKKCTFFIDALSYSMAYRLLETGLPKHNLKE